jgi:hypothetical protein
MLLERFAASHRFVTVESWNTETGAAANA